MTTFTIEVSRALRALGVEKETEKSWSYALPSKGRSQDEIAALEKQITPELYSSTTDWGELYNVLPAFSFIDIIELMPEIGEKCEWGNNLWVGEMKRLISAQVETHKWELTYTDYIAHHLLDAFMEGGYKKAEVYLLGMLKK